MANLDGLQVVNAAGNTKSLYSLIYDLAVAIGKVNPTVVMLEPDGATLEVDAEDGASYFGDVSAQNIEITLPLASENVGMCVFAKNIIDGGLGSLTLKVTGADTIDRVNLDLTLAAANDFASVIATPLGWFLTGFSIAA